MLVLEIHEGISRRSLTVESTEARIGRDRACEVLLHGDPTISRVHAVLRHGEQGWALHDSGSRNGTFVNGQRMEQVAALNPHDRILIGNFLLVLLETVAQAEETISAADLANRRVKHHTSLSAREIEVLRLVCAGHSDKEIAEALVVSVKTVHSHLERIRDKSGCRRRPELLRYAMAHGLA